MLAASWLDPLNVSLKANSAGGIIAPARGARSSMAERLPVEQDAAGSSPAEHPTNALLVRAGGVASASPGYLWKNQNWIESYES